MNKISYQVKFYSPQGSVSKDEFLTAKAAAERWLELVAAGHRTVELKTKIADRKPYGA